MRETRFFEEFDGLKDMAGEKPLVIFFYWPEEDKESGDAKLRHKAELSEKMAKMLAEPELRKYRDDCVWVRVNAKSMEGKKTLARKYGVSGFPSILLVDIEGHGYWRTISPNIKSRYFAKKLKALVKRCEILRRRREK